MNRIGLIIVLAAVFSFSATADFRVGDQAESGKGTIYASSFRGNVNVRIEGEPARLLYDNMSRASERARRRGFEFVVFRTSGNLLCYYFTDKVDSHECLAHVDSAGMVEADNIAFPM